MNRLNTIAYCVSIACLPHSGLMANPAGGTVVNGSAIFSQQGSSLNITNTPGTIINWQNFSIQSDETTRFIQQSADSAVLNRVIGQDPSQILGKLQSNGRVFIINPNGILFGQGSVIDVNGLVASSLNLNNADFLAQQLKFNGDATNGNIINQGAITTAEGGFVYLIAPNIENHGVITSPKGEVILAAGHTVQLVSSNDPDIRVTLTAPDGEALNVGKIITRGGKASIYAGLINQQGTVSADSAIVGENGKIYFKSSQQTTLSSTSITSANGVDGGSVTIKTTQGLTEVSGTVSVTGSDGHGGNIQILGEHVGIINEANIDASGLTAGGTVLIGGDNKGANPDIQNAKATYVGVDAQIHADATQEGDGGTVIVWSDDATRAYGNITAKGGSTAGNGGYVETSGGYLDVAGLKLDVSAVNGKGGTWLLDPYDITISGTTTINTTAGPTYTPTASGSNILNTDINTQLDAGTAVIIDTTGAGAENGNITVSAAITKSTGPNTSLTLKAHNNIVIDQAITSNLGTLDVVLTADQDANSTGGVRVNNQILSNGGNITISAFDDIKADIYVSTVPVLNAGTGDVSLTSSGGAILRFGNTDVLSNNVTLNAATGINGASYFVVNSNNVTFNNSTSGFVNIFNQNTGSPTVTGTNSGGYAFYHGATSNVTTINNISANGYIGFRVDNPLFTGTINAGANDVYFQTQTFNSPMSVNGSSTFNLNNTMLSNITAGTVHIGFDGIYGNYADTVTVSTALGTTFGNYKVNVYGKNGFTLGTAGTTSLGDFSARADVVNISGTLNAGTNKIFLSPFTSNTAVSINGSQGFDLTQTELTNLTSNMIYVGEDSSTTAYAGSIDLASLGAVNIGNRNITIKGSGNITLGANNFVTSGGASDLNIITSGAGSIITGAGQLSSDGVTLNSANNLTIGSGGIQTTTGGINLSAANNISLSGNINSSGGAFINVNTAGGTIDINSNISSPGSSITMSSSGNLSLNATGTDLGGGSVNLTSTNGSIIGSEISSYDINSPSISLTASTGIYTGTTSPFGVNAPSLTFNNSTSGKVILRNYWAAAHTVTGTNSSADYTYLESFNPAALTVNNITTNGNLTILTDIINIVSVNSGTSNLYLSPLNANPISIDGSAAFDLTQGELTNLTFGTLLIGSDGTTTRATTASISSNASTTVGGGGPGSGTIRALNDITFGANNFSVAGANVSFVSDTGNIITGAGNVTAGNLTLNAAGNIIDGNGNGVLDVTATNLTVISGGNASLDYQITGTLNATGVAGTSDLRVYPAGSGGGSSTTEPLVITLATVTDTTNTLTTNTALTTTSTATAPLSDAAAATDSTTDSTSGTTDGETTEETTETVVSDAKTEAQPITSKNLPICK